MEWQNEEDSQWWKAFDFNIGRKNNDECFISKGRTYEDEGLASVNEARIYEDVGHACLTETRTYEDAGLASVSEGMTNEDEGLASVTNGRRTADEGLVSVRRTQLWMMVNKGGLNRV